MLITNVNMHDTAGHSRKVKPGQAEGQRLIEMTMNNRYMMDGLGLMNG